MLSNKKKVLICNQFYLPGYKAGGPIKSLSLMIDKYNEDLDFFVYTSDRDSGDTRPYLDIKSEEWNLKYPEKIFYTKPTGIKLFSILKVIKEVNPDVIYLNSLFSLNFSIIPFIAILLRGELSKVIIAPRGELSQGALNLKFVKKNIFLFLFNISGLANKIFFHATSSLEEKDINKRMSIKKSSILYSPNLISLPLDAISIIETKRSLYTSNATLRLIFLSRITPKKNLTYVIDVLSKLDFNIILDIYGFIDDKSYWELCREKISGLPPNIIISYKGILNPKKVQSELIQYDLMFFPTSGENFGHVILESLSSGTPVLTSTKTPWKLKSSSSGWDLDLKDPSLFAEVLISYSQYSKEKKLTLSRSCLNYYKKIYADYHLDDHLINHFKISNE